MLLVSQTKGGMGWSGGGGGGGGGRREEGVRLLCNVCNRMRITQRNNRAINSLTGL